MCSCGTTDFFRPPPKCQPLHSRPRAPRQTPVQSECSRDHSAIIVWGLVRGSLSTRLDYTGTPALVTVRATFLEPDPWLRLDLWLPQISIERISSLPIP
jgi:hypothetical protein